MVPGAMSSFSNRAVFGQLPPNFAVDCFEPFYFEPVLTLCGCCSETLKVVLAGNFWEEVKAHEHKNKKHGVVPLYKLQDCHAFLVRIHITCSRTPEIAVTQCCWMITRNIHK